MTDLDARLAAALPSEGLTVAVSGGVDSLTLATFAGRLSPITVAHAVSPAVPAEATERVQELAKAEGWRLIVLNAREFDDPAYLKNPVNRCYFCKTNLYARIREEVSGIVAAGTNTDDLGEFRPGLTAAAEHDVIHPYVMAGISKTELRALAARLGLGSVAQLPAQPCLASRVETGIAIQSKDLAFVHEIEALIRHKAPAQDVRCRITHNGVRLETSGEIPLPLLSKIQLRCHEERRPFAGVSPYRRGSAFIGGA